MSIVTQTAEWINMPLGTEVGLGPGDIVLDGDPASPHKKGAQQPLHFSVHVHCGQTAGWIKMPLGTAVGLGPGQIVSDGDSAPHPSLDSSTATATFQPMPIVVKRLDGARNHLVRRPRPMQHCVRWGPAPASRKRPSSPHFLAHAYCGHMATAELYFICLLCNLDHCLTSIVYYVLIVIDAYCN